MQKVAVTITHKTIDMVVPIWDKVHFILQGDFTDLKNLQSELNILKHHINQAMNCEGFALKDVNIKLELV